MNGNVVINTIYDRLYPLNEDKFAFIKENEAGIIDIEENRLYSYNRGEKYNVKIPVFALHSRNLIFFRQKTEWKLIDLSGKQIGESYSGIFVDYMDIIGTISGVITNNKLGLISENGAYILKPLYDQGYCLKIYGRMIVRIDKKWSWLDSVGNLIYEDFDDFKYVLENNLFVRKNDMWYYVSNKGREFRE